MNKKYGLNICKGGKYGAKLYESEEAARNAAEEMVKEMNGKECCSLFWVRCTDDGKVADNNMNVIDEWFGKD